MGGEILETWMGDALWTERLWTWAISPGQRRDQRSPWITASSCTRLIPRLGAPSLTSPRNLRSRVHRTPTCSQLKRKGPARGGGDYRRDLETRVGLNEDGLNEDDRRNGGQMTSENQGHQQQQRREPGISEFFETHRFRPSSSCYLALTWLGE